MLWLLVRRKETSYQETMEGMVYEGDDPTKRILSGKLHGEVHGDYEGDLTSLKDHTA